MGVLGKRRGGLRTNVSRLPCYFLKSIVGNTNKVSLVLVALLIKSGYPRTLEIVQCRVEEVEEGFDSPLWCLCHGCLNGSVVLVGVHRWSTTILLSFM